MTMLAGKLAVISAAASGMGLAGLGLFARSGATVVGIASFVTGAALPVDGGYTAR